MFTLEKNDESKPIFKNKTLKRFEMVYISIANIAIIKNKPSAMNTIL
jgi:hypothetical protein